MLGRCWLCTAWFRRRPPAAGLCANEISAEAEACLSPAVGAILKFHRAAGLVIQCLHSWISRGFFWVWVFIVAGVARARSRDMAVCCRTSWHRSHKFRGWVRSSGLVLHERSTTRILTLAASRRGRRPENPGAPPMPVPPPATLTLVLQQSPKPA